MAEESNTKSALHLLMQNAKRRKKNSPKRDQSGFFPCPAGCGRHVSQRDVNIHLDKLCSVMNSAPADAATANNDAKFPITIDSSLDSDLVRNAQSYIIHKSTSTLRSELNAQSPVGVSRKAKTNEQHNAFSHMMKQSVKVFNSSEIVAKHKFHLHHNKDGRITTSWISDQIDDAIAMDDVVWSATVSVKNFKSIPLSTARKASEQERAHKATQQTVESRNDATTLELEVTSSIPFQQTKQDDNGSNKFNFIQRHSRLSVPHLKSILQKSIRRRAPLPSVRVAMELADKSFSDLIRRLPIIILEDSFLHHDFDLLVWLMVAESKGYAPPLTIMERVFQIIFEMASCPRRDAPGGEECSTEGDLQLKLPSFSLTTPSSMLHCGCNQTSSNKCDTLIRSMLLRAQYGGMACDVGMCHSYAALWLHRFHSSVLLSQNLVSSLPKSILLDDKGGLIYMRDLPQILHEPARQKSKELITREVIAPGGLAKLTEADISFAGIDFHCSPVAESLLSKSHVYLALCERMSSNDREQIASQVKTCIWNYSSGVNRRRALIEGVEEINSNDLLSESIWNQVLKAPFDEYTRQFVKQRLA